MKKLAFLSLLLLITSQIVAQNPCGTTHTPTDKTNWIARAAQLQNGLGSTEELKYVPIKFHLIGNSAGGGFYRQTTPEKVRQQVMKAYSNEEYTFITQPPGTSEWADARGNEHLNFIRKVFSLVENFKKSFALIGQSIENIARFD